LKLLNNDKPLNHLTFSFSMIVIILSAYAVWYGLYDNFELGWDHRLHIETTKESSIFFKHGWVGYGGTYYKLGNLVLLIFSPLFALLRFFGVEIQGVFSSLMLTNILSFAGFLYFLFWVFEIKTRILLPWILLFLSSHILFWYLRAYPDVMLCGLLGVGTISLITYLLIKQKLAYLIFSAVFFGMALQAKPQALLILISLSPLLLISQKPLKDLTVFCSILALVFLAFGFPQNRELISLHLRQIILYDSSWYVTHAASFDSDWFWRFIKNYALITLLPSLPFLFAASPTVKNIRASISSINLKILFISLLISSIGVTIFFLLKPLSNYTQSYTLITLPAHCLLFLFFSSYIKIKKVSYFGVLLFSLAIFFIVGVKNVDKIHTSKTQHYSCIPHWQKATDQLSINGLRTVYTPAGPIEEYSQLYIPEKIYAELVKPGKHQLLTAGIFIDRFKSSKQRLEHEEADIQSRVLDKQVNREPEYG